MADDADLGQPGQQPLPSGQPPLVRRGAPDEQVSGVLGSDAAPSIEPTDASDNAGNRTQEAGAAGLPASADATGKSAVPEEHQLGYSTPQPGEPAGEQEAGAKPQATALSHSPPGQQPANLPNQPPSAGVPPKQKPRRVTNKFVRPLVPDSPPVQVLVEEVRAADPSGGVASSADPLPLHQLGAADPGPLPEGNADALPQDGQQQQPQPILPEAPLQSGIRAESPAEPQPGPQLDPEQQQEPQLEQKQRKEQEQEEQRQPEPPSEALSQPEVQASAQPQAARATEPLQPIAELDPLTQPRVQTPQQRRAELQEPQSQQQPEQELQPQLEPQPAQELQPPPEQDVKPELEPEPEPQPQPEQELQQEPEPQPQPEQEVLLEPEQELHPKPEPEPEQEQELQPESGLGTEPQTGLELVPQSQQQPESPPQPEEPELQPFQQPSLVLEPQPPAELTGPEPQSASGLREPQQPLPPSPQSQQQAPQLTELQPQAEQSIQPVLEQEAQLQLVLEVEPQPALEPQPPLEPQSAVETPSLEPQPAFLPQPPTQAHSQAACLQAQQPVQQQEESPGPELGGAKALPAPNFVVWDSQSELPYPAGPSPDEADPGAVLRETLDGQEGWQSSPRGGEAEPQLDPGLGNMGQNQDQVQVQHPELGQDLGRAQADSRYGYGDGYLQGNDGELGFNGQEAAYGSEQLQGEAAAVRSHYSAAEEYGTPAGSGAAGVAMDGVGDGDLNDGGYGYTAGGAYVAAAALAPQPPLSSAEPQASYNEYPSAASRARANSELRTDGSYSLAGSMAEGVGGGGGYSRGESLANVGGSYSRVGPRAYGGGGSAALQPLPPPAPPQAQSYESEALLAEERERFSQQLQMEVRAREELEDMILRIEKHFKAEQAARKKAEELLQAAISAELEAKNRLEDLMKKRREEQKLLEEERNGIKRERNALEVMRQDFEAELQAARSEVAKAQDALAASEDRIRAAEAVDRARLEAEYQARISALQEEVGRLRDELAYRTHLMASEMTRWQQQAHLTAAAVMEAKNEVLERKRELDCTKEKMDRLLDKLYVGRERGIELSGAIAAAQSFAAQAAGVGVGAGQLGFPMGQLGHPMGQLGHPMGQIGGGLAGLAGLMPPAVLMAHGGGGGATAGGGGLRPPQLQPIPLQSPPGRGSGGGGGGSHSSIPKLPPVNPRPPAGLSEGLMAPGPPPQSGGARRSAPGGPIAYDGGGGGGSGGSAMAMPGMLPGGAGGMGLGPGGMPLGLGNLAMGMGMSYMGAGGIPGMPPGMAGMGGPIPPPPGVLSGGAGGAGGGRSGGGGSSGSAGGAGGEPSSPGDGADPYAHVQSRFAQPADQAKKAGRVVNGRGPPKKPLDRFEESKRDEVRLAAMAKRWG